MNKLKMLAKRIFQVNGGRIKLVKIECNDFKKLPSNNDFALSDPVYITKTNAYRLAIMILSLAQFTHIVQTNLGEKSDFIK